MFFIKSEKDNDIHKSWAYHRHGHTIAVTIYMYWYDYDNHSQPYFFRFVYLQAGFMGLKLQPDLNSQIMEPLTTRFKVQSFNEVRYKSLKCSSDIQLLLLLIHLGYSTDDLFQRYA